MKIEKTECSYQVTECDLKFGEQITLDGELLIPISSLNKVRTEIKDKIERSYGAYNFEYRKGLYEAIEIIDNIKANPKDMEM